MRLNLFNDDSLGRTNVLVWPGTILEFFYQHLNAWIFPKWAALQLGTFAYEIYFYRIYLSGIYFYGKAT